MSMWIDSQDVFEIFEMYSSPSDKLTTAGKVSEVLSVGSFAKPAHKNDYQPCRITGSRARETISGSASLRKSAVRM